MALLRFYEKAANADTRTALLSRLVVIAGQSVSDDDTQMTVAAFLVLLGLKTGENGTTAVTSGGQTVSFGAARAGAYTLIVRVRNAADDEEIGYSVTASDVNGFTIDTIDNATVYWTAIDE